MLAMIYSYFCWKSPSSCPSGLCDVLLDINGNHLQHDPQTPPLARSLGLEDAATEKATTATTRAAVTEKTAAAERAANLKAAKASKVASDIAAVQKAEREAAKKAEDLRMRPRRSRG